MATQQSHYTLYHDNVPNQCWGSLPFCQRCLLACSIHPAALEVHLSAARRILPGLNYCLKAAAHHFENWRKGSRRGETGGGCKRKVRGCKQGNPGNRCIHHGCLTASVSAPQYVPPLWNLHHWAFPTSKEGCASQLRCLLSSWHFRSEQSTSFWPSSAWCRLADLRRHLGYFHS